MRVFVFLAVLVTIVAVVQGQGYGRSRDPRPPQRDVCNNRGHIGTCLGFANLPCRAPGTTCTRIPSSTGGLCCINPERKCRGTCGGFVGALCRPGYECKYRPGSTLGNCCRPSGQCPPPTTQFGTCQFIPGTNCINDSDCRGGKICCPEGCGKICMNPVRGPYH
ncbi:hypothetical protein ACF0H5_021253 [Mactra antiquata]